MLVLAFLPLFNPNRPKFGEYVKNKADNEFVLKDGNNSVENNSWLKQNKRLNPLNIKTLFSTPKTFKNLDHDVKIIVTLIIYAVQPLIRFLTSTPSIRKIRTFRK